MAGSDLTAFTLAQGPEISFIAGMFLGIYFISLAFANRWLLFTDDGWNLKRNIQWFTFIITNAIAIPVSINQVMKVRISVADAQFVEQGHPPGEYVESHWMPILQCGVTIVAILLADIVLIYRLWMTFMKRWKFVWFPTILWFGCLSCMVLQLFLMIENVHNPDFGPYKWATVNMVVGPGIALIPLLGLSIVLNVYCSGLLIRRIWKSLQESGNSSSKTQLQLLIRVLLESGILYLSTSIVHFGIWFGYDNYPIHVMGSIHTAVIGIVNNLIIIRVGQTRLKREEHHTNNQKLTTIMFVEDETTSRSSTYQRSV
ncbi:hypothetical protein Agabi119p4_1119 [Agaricus bisporus var. burnettii]|uniref:Uncharacterized protein n=1 Tax=Agaricus bisporus var. burnettii TaxID=192524 RepID=A0A8H7FC02_AGABI|nr:hypothetical protein Agabi119p4_1119 [Agaricus bisporus var. burnettii]